MRFVIPWSFCVSKRDKTDYYRGKPRRSEKWKAALRATNLLAASQRPPGMKAFEGPVDVQFRIVFPTRRQTDPHNYMEVILDGLEGVAYLNDQQARTGGWCLVGYSKDEARIEVIVSPVSPSILEQLQQELNLQ